MKLRYCWLLAAVALFSGCGREARIEAVSLCKTLQQKSADFTKANAMEQELVASAKSWTATIMASGSGRGDQLNQNAAVATDLAKSAVVISELVGTVRQAVYADESIKEEYPQSVRTTLITQLTARQRFLQETRAALDAAASGFQDLGRDKAYKGDSYPGGVSTLNASLDVYKAPDDVVGTAIKSLRSRYSIQDADLAK